MLGILALAGGLPGLKVAVQVVGAVGVGLAGVARSATATARRTASNEDEQEEGHEEGAECHYVFLCFRAMGFRRS